MYCVLSETNTSVVLGGRSFVGLEHFESAVLTPMPGFSSVHLRSRCQDRNESTRDLSGNDDLCG